MRAVKTLKRKGNSIPPFVRCDASFKDLIFDLFRKTENKVIVLLRFSRKEKGGENRKFANKEVEKYEKI